MHHQLALKADESPTLEKPVVALPTVFELATKIR
jgi:hypothetical protein